MNKEVLRLAIPNIVSNLTVPMLSIVDMALMGHQDSSSYVVGLGMGIMLLSFLYWAFSFLRMSTTGLTARAFGEGDDVKCVKVLVQGGVLALLVAAIFIVLQKYVFELGMLFIEDKKGVGDLVADYFFIRIWAAPAALLSYVFTGWWLGRQNARIPMIAILIINVSNAVLSYYFVMHLHMDIKGAALGTVVAQYLGLALYLVVILRQKHWMDQLRKVRNVLSYDSLKPFIQTNSAIFVRTLSLIFTLSFFKVKSLELSETIGAVNLLLLELYTLASFGIDGFAFAAESLSGKYIGRGEKKYLKKSIKYLFVWATGLAGVYVVIYFFFGTDILRLLSDHEHIIIASKAYLPYMIIFPVVSVVSFIWDGVFIGVGADKALRNTMLFSTFIVFIPSYYLLVGRYENHALWIALLLFLVARGGSQTVLYFFNKSFSNIR